MLFQKKNKLEMRFTFLFSYSSKGTFMTIFLPTILLNIIGHSTNYFKPFFFEAIVTVNLTVSQNPDQIFFLIKYF